MTMKKEQFSHGLISDLYAEHFILGNRGMGNCCKLGGTGLVLALTNVSACALAAVAGDSFWFGIVWYLFIYVLKNCISY